MRSVQLKLGCGPRLLTSSAIPLVLGLTAVASATPQEIRLNGPIAASLPFSISEFLTSADGTQAFLLGDLETDGVIELFRVDVPGSGALSRLSGTLVSGGDVGGGFGDLARSVALAPNGDLVVYVADQEQNERFELFSVKARGGPQVKVSGTLDVALGLSAQPFRITSDVSHVVFLAHEGDFEVELFRAPVGGREDPIRLNAPLLPSANVVDFLPSPDGRWIVYRAHRRMGTDLALYLVPSDGSALARVISGPAVSLGNVSAYAFSLDSRFVVFLGDLLGNERFELFSTNLEGPPVRLRLNGGLPTAGDVTRFAVAADSRQVVYLADQRADGQDELFRVSIRARGSSVLLSAPLVEGGDVLDFVLAPRGEGLVYRADQLEDGMIELFGTTRNAQTAPARLNAPLPPFGDVHEIAAITPDGARVLYLADEEADEHFRLFSVRVLGDEPRVFLDGTREVEAGSVALPTDGQMALYRAREGPGGIELFGVGVEGSAPPERLCQALVSGRQVLPGFQIPADASTVLYLSDLERAALFELHTAPLDAGSPAVQVTHTRVGPVLGDVYDYRITPDGNRVVYRADQEVDQVFELYSVAADGKTPPMKLNPPLVAGGSIGFDSSASVFANLDSFQFSSDGARVVYFARQESSQMELFSVPTDGSAPAVRLSAGSPVGPTAPAPSSTFIAITPDDTRVLYMTNSSDLFVVPIDGSAPPLLLSNSVNNGVWTFAVDPSGSRAAYIADHTTRDAWELFSVPVAGGVPVRLHPTLGILRDVKRYQHSSLVFAPDGSRVLYQADADMNDAFVLFSVRTDGSQGPFQLSAAIGDGRDASPGTIADFVQVTADGQRAVYWSGGIFSRPIDGSGAPIRLDPAVPPDDPIGFRVHPSSPTVLLQVASTFDIATAPLYSVPQDGSAAALVLSSEAMGLHLGPIRLFYLEFGAGGARVVFNTFDELDRSTELHSVPAVGSTPSVPLFDFGGDGFSVGLRPGIVSADGQRVLFVTDSLQLFVAPIEGSSLAEALTAPLAPGRNLRDIRPAPTGDRVLFRADRDEAGTVELFAVQGSVARRRPW